MSSRNNLSDRFRQQFELLPALDDASRAMVYRIRHEVYCRDLGWEPVRADGMERDEFDDRSVHCLLTERHTGEPVGCTRLIFCSDDDVDPLPIETTCEDVIDRAIIDPRSMDRSTLGEVSRLAVMRHFRQRRGESETAVSVNDEDFAMQGLNARFPFIPVSLYLGATAIAHCVGREHILVLTEPRLAAHFAKIGFAPQPIGGEIEHRGVRLPSIIRTSQVEANLRPLIRPLYEEILDGVQRAFAAQHHPQARALQADLHRAKPALADVV